MAFFNFTRWLRSQFRPRGKTVRNRWDRRIRPSVELLEDRTLFAVLPTALVSNPTTLASGNDGGFSPDVVQDPTNPLKLIEVHTTGSLLVAEYSLDGGASWSGFINTGAVPNLTNLNDPTTTGAPYTVVTNPTVTIDRAENVYITDIERNAALTTAGALVMQRFRFIGSGSPTHDVSSEVIHQWVHDDPIENPVVAVDNNVPSFTDPTGGVTQAAVVAQGSGYVVGDILNVQGGTFTTRAQLQVTSVSGGGITGVSVLQAGSYTVVPGNPANVSGGTGTGATFNLSFPTQTDTMATLAKDGFGFNGTGVGKSLYVAWNTSNTLPQPVPNNFDPNIIMVTGSGDGGDHWTAPQIVSDGGNVPTLPANGASPHFADPQIVFTQGTYNGTVTGGQLVFVWNDYGNNTFQLDSSLPDNQNPATLPAASYQFAGTTGQILDGGIRVNTATVSNGGTNYKIGDVLTLSNGTVPAVVAPPVASNQAQLTVTEIGAQAIISIANGGSGYAANDVLNVLGGTSSVVAQITVNTVSGTGAVLTASITTVGSYSVLPTNAVATVDTTTGTASGATFNIQWGVVTKVNITNRGSYIVPPTAPSPDTVTGGSGAGATFTLTFGNPISDLPTSTTFTDAVNIPAAANFVVNDLSVTLDFTAPLLNDLDVQLVSPSGTIIQLFRNQTDGLGNPLAQGISGANLGEINGNLVGTIFDDNAPRSITNPSFNAPYIATFTPEVGKLDVGTIAGQLGNSANITGTWQLIVTDHKNDGETTAAAIPNQHVDKWVLNFSHISTTGFGTDKTTPVASIPNPNPQPTDPVPGAAIAPYGQVNTGPFGPEGVGPGLSVAIDNTLGAFSPYQGRLYIAYTGRGGGGIDTNVYLLTGDSLRPDLSPRWNPNGAVKVNDDSVTDNFSEGNRPQYMPTVAVDQVTGTVGVMYYDGRWDPSAYMATSRAANSFSDSIDGGQTFSTSTFFNTPKTTTDMITKQVITIEPIPGNVYQANATFGFGDRQGLVMNAGKVVPVFASNPNLAVDANNNPVGNSIISATVTIAAGPRIIQGDMGPITNTATFLGNGYNETFALDGTQQFTGFEVIFDRPILISSFTPSQVTVMYHDTVTPAALPDVPVAVGSVTPVNAGIGVGNLTGNTTGALLANTFLITLASPQSAVGTYSYAIGNINGAPSIRDGLKQSNTAGALLSLGNFMDQNQDAVTGEKPTANSSGDVFAVPTPTNGPPFQLPYNSETHPIGIPGPYVTSTSVAFNPDASQTATDNLVLNGTNNGVDVNFDRNINPATFTPANILRIEGPLGPITSYTLGPAVSFVGGGGTGASGIATIENGVITAVFIENGGSGFTSSPTVVFNGGGGFGAIGTATVVGGVITGVTITSGGAGYTGMTPISFTAASTITVPMAVPDSLQINDMSVALDITDPDVSHLNVTLVAPDGTSVTLVPVGTLAGANLTGSTFDDFASTLITGGTAPYNNVYRPVPPVLSATVAAGGSGYNVGDILTVQGGTFLSQAQLLVTGVSGTGAVTNVSILQSGAYSVQPYNPVSVVDATTPSASGASFTLKFGGLSALNGHNYFGMNVPWQLQIRDTGSAAGARSLNAWSLNPVTVSAYNQGAVGAASVVNGGSFYKVGDLLTVQGGVYATTPLAQQALLQVTSIGANGAVTGVTIQSAGLYAVPPTSPVTVVGNDGAAATFDLNFGVVAGTVKRFHISLPTQSLNGTYSVVVGPDSVGNYIQDTALNRASIVAGGSKYSVGDILQVQGGTGTAAKFEVTTVNAGAVTAVELVDPGAYTVDPTSPVNVTDLSNGAASGAMLNLFFGNKVDTALNAGVDLLMGAAVTGGTLLKASYPSGTVNTPIPAGQTIQSTINVPDSYLVQGVTVTLTILHNNDPDLVATLIAPDGTSDLLFSGVGTSGTTPHANFTNTTLDDSSLTPIQLAATIPITGISAGPYDPQQPLTTAFQGHGSLGNWILQITSNSSTINGTLVNWTLTLKNSVDGQGALVASQFTAPFRIFTQDPTNSVSQQSWTAIGPASINNGGDSGRIGGLAIDPSDPSGNTVYTAGASGGVWKTTDFMTTSPNGPTWSPLTNVGPSQSLNTGSIAIFGRNGDPNQSIVFVSTGEGDTNQPGVGFIRSMDAGRTWELLDSRTNVYDTTNDGGNHALDGQLLPINSPLRDHRFVGTTSFKVIVDPTAEPDGNVIVYAAMGTGVWRSVDTGGHWTLIQSGFATDVALAAGSAGTTGNLQILYAAVEGAGVYFTGNAPTTLGMTLRTGNTGNSIRRDVDVNPDTAIPINNDNVGPQQGGSGRIVLATPALTNNPLENTLYEGWCYAVVNTASGTFGGLYVTKDFGLNWTQIQLPVKKPIPTNPQYQISTNDIGPAFPYSVDGSAKFPQANYDVSIAVDPNNPGIIYIGGTADANPLLNGQYGGFIRVDATTVVDPYATFAYDNSNHDGGKTQFATQGAVTVKGGGISQATGAKLGPGQPYGMINPNDPATLVTPLAPYVNMLRDPESPFLTPASLQFTNIASFGNSGEDATYGSFTGGGLGGTDQHRLIAFRDPLTGKTRLIFGDDQGIWTGTDNGDGNPTGNVGSAISVDGSRNGNLQITQFYDGATQPSTIAAQAAQALFYGVAQDDGFPVSPSNTLDTGNIAWSGGEGDGSGVKTDQTGSGNAYWYKWPCCGGSNPLPTDFWSVVFPVNNEVSRTTGLIQAGDNPGGTPPTGQWPFLGGSKFAVNPIDGTSIAMSSSVGRIFLTSDSEFGLGTGTGVDWFPIAEPNWLDSTYAPAIAFGAPQSATTTQTSDFIYVGTTGGHIYVTFTAGQSAAAWKNISAGLDGQAVQFIVANPNRGSHEAYAVTLAGVYWMPDSSVAGAKWINVNPTGNIFNQQHELFNDPNQTLNPTAAGQKLQTLAALTAIQADWRYAIPNSSGAIAIAAAPVGATEFNDVVTITTTVPHGLTVGENINISGVGVAGYNGIATVTSVPSPTTFTYVTNFPIHLANSGGGLVTPTHPVLYVGGIGGVFRSFDQGKTWTFFPDTTIDGAQQEGGQLPSTSNLGVTDLALSLGNINPLNGTPSQPYGRDLLVATTYGVGSWAIRLNDQVIVPGGNPLFTYAVNPVAGPHVVSIVPVPANPAKDDLRIVGMDITFSGPVDPVTFTVNKVLSVTDPFGNAVPIGSIRDLGAPNHNQYEIIFAAQPLRFGFYDVTLSAAISDYAGNKLDQNQNGINGETPGDIVLWRVLYQPFINPTNYAPVLNTTLAYLGADLEDSAAASVPTTSVNAFIMALPNGGITDQDNLSQPPDGYAASNPSTIAPVGIAVTGVDNTNGDWQYSLDNGADWVDFGPLGALNSFAQAAVLLEGSANGVPSPDLIRFLPNAGFAGTATFTFKAWDETSGLTGRPIPNGHGQWIFGADGGTADTTGASTAFSSATATATVQVLFVNDQPSFTATNPTPIAEDTVAPQTVTGFATFFPGTDNLPGPDANEAGQTALSYTVTNVTNGALFSAAPTVTVGAGGNGDLHYTLNPDIYGTSQFTVTLQDTGGLQVTGAAVNLGGSGYVVGDVITIQGGTLDPSGTAAQLVVTSVGGGGAITGVSVLTQDGNYVGPAGTPAAVGATVTGGHGTNATFNLTFGGVDTSVSQTFTISVLFVNDQPSFTANNPPFVLEDSGSQTVNGWVTGFNPGGAPDANELGQAPLQYLVTAVTPGFFSSGPSINPATGALSYTLIPGVHGAPQFTVQVQDNAGLQAVGVLSIAAGGSGYVVGDVLTVSGGTLVPVTGLATQLLVTSVDPTGAVTGAVVMQQNGNYEGPAGTPANPASVTGGTGSSATFNLNYSGVDIGVAQTYTLNVLFVNDQPNYTASNPPFVLEDSGAHTVANWATNFYPGGDPGPDANESGQSIRQYIVSNVTPGFFSSGPSVANNGTLSYTLLPGIHGSPSFNVQVQDNGGQQVVGAVVANGGSGYTVGDLLTVQSGTFVAPPAGQGTGSGQAVLQVTSVGAGGKITGVTILPQQDGDYLSFPANPVSALGGTGDQTATFTITTAGVDTSVAQTFTLNVLFVNDQPNYTASNPPFALEDSGAHTVSGWASGFLPGTDNPTQDNNEAGQNVLQYVVTNVTPGFFSAGPSINPVTGDLSYTLLPGVDGAPQFTVQVQDNGGQQVVNATLANAGSGYSVGDQLTIQGGSFLAPPAGQGTGTGQTVIDVTSVSGTGAITGFTIDPQQDGDYQTLPASPAGVSGGTGAGATFTLTPGGTDISAAQTFTLNVLFVNDVPNFTASNPPFVLEDTGAHTVANWATNFQPGTDNPTQDSNEQNQAIRQYIVSNVTPGFFSSGPSVANNGTLSYTLLPGVSGAPTFNVQVQDTGGQQIINANVAFGGSGYVVGDLLTVQSGTFVPPPAGQGIGTGQAVLQVTSVAAGGVITGVTIVPNENGDYTALPANPVSVSGGAGSGATFTLTSGGIDTSIAQTFTLNVLFVNDIPTFTATNPPFVLEDSGAQTVPNWATNFLPGSDNPAQDPNEQNQLIRQYIVSNVTPGFFSSGPTVANNGTLSYTLLPGVSGAPTFQVQVQDTGGQQVINAAVANAGSGYVVGDLLTVQGGAFAPPPAGQGVGTGQAVLQVTSIGAGGVITGVTILPNQDGDYTTLPASPVTVTGGSGTNATFNLTFQPNGAVDTSVAQTFTLNVLFVNDQPTFTGSNPPFAVEDSGAHTVPGWATGFQTGSDNATQDANEAGQAIRQYLVSNVTPGFFSAGPSIAPNGTLTYTLLPNVNGTPSFQVQVQDNGGQQIVGAAIGGGGTGYSVGDQLTVQSGTFSAPPASQGTGTGQAVLQVTSIGAGGVITGVTILPNQDGDYTALPTNPVSVTGGTGSGATFTLTSGGVDTSVAQTFTLNVLFVNDQPSFTANNPPSVNEDTVAAQTVSNWVTGFNPGGVPDLNEQGQGVKQYIVSNVTNAGWFTALPTVDPSGNLHYQIVPNVSGLVTFQVQVQDNAGLQVLAASISVGGSGYKVGDLLTVQGGTVITPAVLQVTAIGAGGAVTGVTVTTQDGNYTGPAGIPVNPVTVTDTTTPAASGAKFNLGSSGVDISTAQTFTLSVNFINDQPSFVAANPANILEDNTAAQSVPFATFSPGGAPDLNEKTQSVYQYIVTNVTNPSLFASGPTIDTSGNLHYQLAANQSGATNFTVAVEDNAGLQVAGVSGIVSGGTGYVVGDVLTVVGGTFVTPAKILVTSVGAGGAINGVSVTAQDGNYTGAAGVPANPVSLTGGTGTGASFNLAIGGVDTSATQTFTLNVLFVNDQPSFTASNPPFINEDNTAPQTITGWVTNFNPGGAPDANEASQTVKQYIVTNVTNPGLFASPPTVDTSGNLHYTLNPNVSGITNFTVQVQDNGGTANGGIDTSLPQTFALTVNFVNDQPSFTASNPASVLEDSGIQTVANWATFNPGGAETNENGQKVLQYSVTGVTNPGLFAVPPSIDKSGNLTYTLNPNVSGSSNFSVAVQDNAGVQVLNVPGILSGGSGYKVGDILTVQGGTIVTAAQLLVTSVSAGGAITGVGVTSQDGNYTGLAGAPTNPVSVADVTTPAATGASLNLAIGGQDTSATQTFTINVTFVNDQPSFTASNPPSVLEDTTALQTVANWAAFNPGTGANEQSQVVKQYNVTNVTNASLFASGPSVDTSGNLIYALNPNVSGSSAFTVTVQDNGGTANGGVDTSVAQTFTLNVLFVNDQPTFLAGNPPAVNEDVTAAQTNAGFIQFFNPGGVPDGNEQAQAVKQYTVSNISNPGLFTSLPTITNSGNLQYALNPNVSGVTTFTIQAQDVGGLQVLGAAVNASGTGYQVGDVLTVQGGTPDAGGSAAQLQVISISAGGAITGVNVLNPDGNYVGPTGTPPAAGATVTGGHGSGATFNLTFGGTDTSAQQTVTLTVNFVNDQPSFTASNPPAINEDTTAQQTVANWATFNPGTGTNEASQTVKQYTVTNVANPNLFAQLPTVDNSGNLHYAIKPNVSGTSNFSVVVQDNGGTLNGGVDTSNPQTYAITVNFVNDQPSFTASNPLPVNEDTTTQQVINGWATFNPGGAPDANEAGQSVLAYIVGGISNPSLFAAPPSVDTNGNLSYTLNPDVSGSSQFTVKVQDNGGTAFGGIDTSVPQTFTLTVNFVNDQPSFTASSTPLVINEDVTTPQTVSGFITGFSPGGTNPLEQSQTVKGYIVSNVSNPGLFAAGPSVDLSGNLQYALNPNVSGTSSFNVQVQDNGGTAFGGVDTSAAQTFSVTVNFINDQPSFTASNPLPINENNTSLQTVNGFITSFNPGGLPDPNELSQQVKQYLVSNVTNASLFSVLPTISNNGTLTYAAAPNESGIATFTVQVQDNGGTALGGVDTSNPQTFTIQIGFVNQPPSFNLTQSATVLEDAGSVSLPNFATNISAGPGNQQTAETVSFIVTNVSYSSPYFASLFASPPTISPTGTASPAGTLAFTTAPNANGTATITVVAKNTGGTANNGVDTSAAQTFTINVTPVNDPPSFTKGADQSIPVGTGAQSVANWATSILAGPPDEVAAKQTVGFLVTGDTDPGLFQTPPSIDASGTLTYTPTPNAVGSASITIVAKDNGGTANGGVDTSLPQTFNISVTPDNSRVAVNTSAAPAVSGQLITFTATVSSAGPLQTTPAGTVDFIIDNGAVALGVPLVHGQATYQTSTLTVGGSPHTVLVQFHDSDGLFNPNSGTLVNGQTVVAANTQVAVTASLNPAQFGSTVTFTATVSPTGGGTGIPDGTVTFVVDGSTQVGPFALVGGQASFPTSGLTVGPHNIQANYTPGVSGNFNASIGFLPNGETITKAQSNTSLTVDFDPSRVNEPVTFTATVSATAATPTGSVTFTIDGVAKATVPLNGSSQASYTIATLTLNTNPGHTVVAQYNGNATLAGSSNTTTQFVKKAGTKSVTMTATPSPSPANFGDTVTFTAQVKPVTVGGAVPTGAVTFYVDGVNEGTIPLDGTGTAQVAAANLNAGSHTVKYSYWGDDTYAALTKTGSLTVNKAQTFTSLATSGSPAVVNTPITFVATVGSGVGQPTGNVNFYVDGTLFKTVAIVGNQATYTTTSLGIAKHTVMAQYAGSANYAVSSDKQQQIVQSAGTAPDTTTLNSSENPANFGDAVTISALVADPTGAGIPTGWVRFNQDGNLSALLPLDGTGQASIVYPTLGAGSHSISAKYFGDLTYAVSTGTLKQLVYALPTHLFASVANGNATNTVNLTITALSASGATALGDNDPVSYTVTGTPLGGTLNGPNSGSFTNGSITFPNLQVSLPGTYTVHIVSDTFTLDFSFTIGATGRLA